MKMYLLRKVGIPLAVILIISIMTLVWVTLIFEKEGLLLPSFERPRDKSADTAEPIETNSASDTNERFDFIKYLFLEERTDE